MKKLKTTVKKSEQLQGPVKTKKITVKDFKKENDSKKEVLKNNKEVLNNNKLLPYERIITDDLDNVYYKFYNYMNEQDLKIVSEDYLKFKIIKLEVIKIMYQLKRQNTQERKLLFILSMEILLNF